MKTLKEYSASHDLLCAMPVCQTASAVDPDVTQWSLPKDAIARFGRGSITDVAYSPNGTYLAVKGFFRERGSTMLRPVDALKMFPNFW